MGLTKEYFRREHLSIITMHYISGYNDCATKKHDYRNPVMVNRDVCPTLAFIFLLNIDTKAKNQ